MHATTHLTPAIRSMLAANITPKPMPDMVIFMSWVCPDTQTHCVSSLEPYEVAASADALLREGIGFSLSVTPV